jgi:hypothetical protein
VEEERRLVRDQVLVEAEGAAGKHGFIAQYVGPATGKGPIYDGRFNVQARKDLAQENLQV